ncbi:MAG: long-chain-fatty-acid--CoA ligase [Rhodospirillales bacterium]|nr:long-chain-fatty-acid--CoA ligase [Rhodospirillales bacterium]
MLGLMQDHPLLVSGIITHAARNHRTSGIVARTSDGLTTRETYDQAELRARQLARALARLGVRPGDRVATLGWNDHRHVELYYAISGSGAICHTVNPRLAADDIAFIMEHAGDVLLFADPMFAPLVATVAPRLPALRDIVFMAGRAAMPVEPKGLCFEELLEEPIPAWPTLDERSAAALCYTSGTTGRPKGVLYSHRSTLLHAFSVAMPDVLGLRAVDRCLPVVPMFHVNAWGFPYACPMVGASLVMPGRFLDGASLARLMNEEMVTCTAGVPTVWLALLQHLRASGERLGTLQRMLIGGSACPRLLIEGFAEQGVRVDQGWGMTELSPVGTYNAPNAVTAGLAGEAQMRLREKQGRALFNVEMRIVDEQGDELPSDGARSGHLQVRGPFVASAYYGEPPGSALDSGGWFATGDVASIDTDGYMEITDRSKDVIKSGGEWISSVQLENLAVAHPAVAEAAVIAARHPTWDERPLLLVVPKAGQEITCQAMRAFLAGKVAKWWLPDDVITLEALPHTATGKISKRILREQFRDHLVNKAH